MRSDRRFHRGRARLSRKAPPEFYRIGTRWVMRRCWLWAGVLFVLASAGGLSGCYYDPYTGGYYPYPPYPYPYPYRPPYPYPYPGPPPPRNPNAPVQQMPLSPPQ